MVVPIGIDPLNGIVAAYSTVTGDLATLNIKKITPSDSDKIDGQFKLIKEHFPAFSYNVCVCVNENYSNDIRLAFVENAKNHGFMNFSILDFSSALYIHAVFKSAFKSKTGDDVWIFWKDHCYVYEHINDSIVFWQSYPNLTKTNKNVLAKLEKPVAVFYQLNTTKIANYLYPDAIFYYFTTFLAETAALIKAQFLMDNKMPSLKITPCCNRKIEIFVNEKSCLTIVPEQTLPYENIVEIMDASKNLKLKIVENDIDVKELSFNGNGFIFSIDSNGIYSIANLDDKAPLQEIAEENKPFHPLKVSNDTIEESPANSEKTVQEKEPSLLPPPNIKLAMPDYIIPEKFEYYVEMIHRLGYIQTELNILNPLVAITNTEFNFQNFDYLKKCYDSYKAAIVHLESLLENVKVQVDTENNKLGSNYLKDITSSIVTKHTTLKQNYEKNNEFLQNAEMFFTSYNEEMEWINSKLNNDEMKFDNLENSMNALKIYKTLKHEANDHEINYRKLIIEGKKFINKSNKDAVEEFTSKLEDNWKKLEEYLNFYLTIIAKVKKVVECCKTADAIEEWISVKTKMLPRRDFNTGSSVIQEILMKKLLEEAESYFANIITFEREANANRNEIILSGDATRTKLSVILDALKKRVEEIKQSYNNLKENINNQIRKLDEEKIAFEFNKKCNTMEQWINQITESVDVEITKENLEMARKFIEDAEKSKRDVEHKAMGELMEISEKLVAVGFPEAKIKIKNIENLQKERDIILEEKKLEIEVEFFVVECDNLIKRTQNKIDLMDKSSDENQLQDYEKTKKLFQDNFEQLSETCKNLKNANIKYPSLLYEKMKELHDVNKKFNKLIETKLKESKSEDLTFFFDAAYEMVEFLEHITSEIECCDAGDIDATSYSLMEEHLTKLKENISSKEEKIKEIQSKGVNLMDESSSVTVITQISDMLMSLTTAKETVNLAWKKRYKELQRIECLSTFDSIADAATRNFVEYFEILNAKEEKNIEENQKSNMLAEINLHIDSIQKAAEEVNEKRNDLVEYVYTKVNEILDLRQKLVESLAKCDEQQNEETVDNPAKTENPESKTAEVKDVPSPPDPTPLSNKDKYFIPRKLTNYDNKINAIGIDLGTSRCVMAVSRNNKIETIPLENTGGRSLPSFVSFDEEDDKCGDVVVKGFLKDKEKYTVFDVKRFIGKEFHEIILDESWPFTVIEEENITKIVTETVHGEAKKKPEEISAVLLKHMKDKAIEFEGKKLTEAVLTFPAAFTESQKQATLEAAKLAGWNKIHLLPEPLAASFAYFNNRDIPNNSNVLLFDLGGGTLDVCCFKVVDQKIEVLSNTGDSRLGGRDIDNLLIRHFATILKHKYNINVNQRKRRRYQLMLECQSIKENLTVMKNDSLNVDTFDSNADGKIELERNELDDLMTELLQRMKNAINQALSNAKFTPKDIKKVLQVGGGCRMPIVKKMLQNMFPQAEHCCEEHPDEVVAIGAAIYAYHLVTQNL